MENINNSSDVYSSSVVHSSSDVYSSGDVYSSSDVYSSRNVIFCYDIKCKEYYAFNKQVTEDRFYEIINLWNNLKGDFKLELENNQWTDEWKKLPNSVWQELAKLPEWDINVVEKITGFKPNIEISKEMTVAEISEKLGYEVKVIK